MTLLHSGYPPQPTSGVGAFRHRENKPPMMSGGAFRLHHDDDDDEINQGRHVTGAIGIDVVGGHRNGMRRVSNASSNGSFENMSRPAYTGRDTDRFFGGDFELDDHHDSGVLHDDDYAEDEDEQLCELVPLGGASRRRRCTPRRTKSLSQCGFFDFYKLTDEHLGSGAYGSVTTCTSVSTGLEYAVKIVDKEGQTHSRQRILREVNIFNACKNHPNIVQLVDWFEDEDSFYLVMEKMRGGPLLQHILQKGYFTEEEARCVTKDIASALKYMHDRGIAHRDVKPENVLCTEPDRVSPVKLCDLDLASQRQSQDRHERTLCQVASEPDLASPVGSAEFMAPEVVDAFVGDALKYDKKCDTWSLGVILYIMLAGYAPFQGECDDDNCGWSDGQPCDDCQQELFQRIQSGYYTFPEEEWSMISAEAKDLVSNLLKRDPSARFNADQILTHPWLQQSAPSTILQTPSNLTYRKDSARDVQQMSEHFNVMNRFVAARLSARMDGMSLEDMENGGATATVNDASFLLVGGEPFGGFATLRKKSSATMQNWSSNGIPVSRASPTTPPPSMIDQNFMGVRDELDDSRAFTMFSSLNIQDDPSTPLSPMFFGISTPNSLFGGAVSAATTPRRTTTDDDVSMLSFESSSPPPSEGKTTGADGSGSIRGEDMNGGVTCPMEEQMVNKKNPRNAMTHETDVKV